MGIIYSLIDPSDNLIKYIGRTNRDLSIRLYEHINIFTNDKKSAWIKSLKLRGYDPFIEVLDEVEDTSFWEMYYISLYRSWGFNLKNMNDGGDHSPNLSSETRDKMRSHRKNKTYAEIYGKERGIVLSKNHSSKLKGRVSDKKGKTYAELYGISAQQLIDNKTKLFKEINADRKNKKNAEIFGTELACLISDKISNAKKKYEILQIDKNTGIIIKEWASIKQICENNFKRATIYSCCCGNQRTAYGFIWKYKNKQ